MAKARSAKLRPASMKLFRGRWKDVASEFLSDGHQILQRPNGHLVWKAPGGSVWSAASCSDARAAIHRHLGLLKKAGWEPRGG